MNTLIKNKELKLIDIIGTQGQLPEKLSDCIEIALNDLEITESLENIDIDMDYWYEPKVNEDVKKTEVIDHCYVCFAGSVMINSLKPESEEVLYSNCNLIPEHYNGWDENRLYALDAIRSYEIKGALEHLYENVEILEIDEDLLSGSYKNSPEIFKQNMKIIIESLRSVGL